MNWKGRNEKSSEREDRLSKTSDGREVRELELRSMEEGEMKGEIEDEVMEEEREMIEFTKVVESIENTRFKRIKTVEFKTPK